MRPPASSNSPSGSDRAPSLRPGGVLALAWLLALAATAYLCIVPFVPLFHPTPPHHWDFAVYRAASLAQAEGLDPQNLGNLKRFGTEIPYNYGPLFSLFFLPLFRLPGAEYLFVLAKIACLAGGAIWINREFEWSGARAVWTYVFCAVAFCGAAQLDFLAGNISGFEFFILCGALVAALRRKSVLFVVLITLLAFGKPTWIVFTPLAALLDRDRAGLATSAAAFAASLLTQAISFLTMPGATIDFIRKGTAWRERGFSNPCLREFCNDLMRATGQSASYGKFVWLLSASAITVPTLVTTLRQGDRRGRLLWSSLVLLELPLFMPRYKPYSFLLLAPFALIVLRTVEWSRVSRAVATALLIGTGSNALLQCVFLAGYRLQSALPSLVIEYVQLFTLSAVVLMVLFHQRRPSRAL